MIRLRNSLYIIALATALSACSKTKFSEASGSANQQSLSGGGPSIEALLDNPDLVDDYACGKDMVYICHEGQTLCLKHCEVEKHMSSGGGKCSKKKHNDTLGPCVGDPPGDEEVVDRGDDDDDDIAQQSRYRH